MTSKSERSFITTPITPSSRYDTAEDHTELSDEMLDCIQASAEEEADMNLTIEPSLGRIASKRLRQSAHECVLELK
jgi:hypothetical protein